MGPTVTCPHCNQLQSCKHFLLECPEFSGIRSKMTSGIGNPAAGAKQTNDTFACSHPSKAQEVNLQDIFAPRNSKQLAEYIHSALLFPRGSKESDTSNATCADSGSDIE